ncbi:hypothetical protein P3T37_002369 [Kitasatospora sp. MAA4]|uniref:glycoside hydrolase domain-containing protein n=1 Tax=Kitasatospora sp. MAA4 TaxID=3035093 RepID=UPI00247706A0|nr:glycoside hydrolase domain-containing protein [Kitasatospora sp. MAA4]MDH6132975.1 hypothetical protein [Kitasatospora sp. MAA4]
MQRRLRNSAAVLLLTSAGLSTGLATAQAAEPVGTPGTPQPAAGQADAPAAAAAPSAAPSASASVPAQAAPAAQAPAPQAAAPAAATPPAAPAASAPAASAPAAPAAPAAKSAAPQVGPQQGGMKDVRYQGYQLKVPASWQVVDLTSDPNACVRFDENAVYLGTPGADQDCPAHLIAGRTDALLIQPAPAGGPAVQVVDPGTALPASVLAAGAADHQLEAQIRGTGLQVTATYGTDPQQVDRILAGASVTAAPPAASAAPRNLTAAPHTTTAAPHTTTAAPHSAMAVPTTDSGSLAFDTCSAPAASTMDNWAANSPYRAVGIYIGGPAQACAQPNLTADWVGGRAAEGWSFMPIYVGPQASVGSVLISADGATAVQQGRDAAMDAIHKASALGFHQGAVLYNDMESYDSGTYRDRVLAYLSGWTSTLRGNGYRSGVYASASSGVQDLSAHYADTSYPAPDVIWSAAWNSHHDVSDAGMGLPGPTYWSGGRRAHQYEGGTTETYGGVSVNIDASALNVSSQATGQLMSPGQRLGPGQSLTSANVTLSMQWDGNLVVYLKGGYGPGQALWSSQTYGNSGAYALMQWDGNFVVYRADGVPLWASNTYGSFNGSLSVQDDGNVVLYRANGTAAWASGTEAAWWGGPLTAGHWTQGALTRLVMQSDGNLVMYRKRDGAALWATGTNWNPGAYAVMQGDGNLVVYRGDGAALWSSGTWGHPGATLAMQDDGNLVIYRPGNTSPSGALWATGTWTNAR